MEALEQEGLTENTLVVFTSDHGGLTPVLSGGGKLPERPLLFHFPHYSQATGLNSALVKNDWKLIRFCNEETGRRLLYNLAEDPFEQHDLSTAMPDQARSLDERLTRLPGPVRIWGEENAE